MSETFRQVLQRAERIHDRAAIEHAIATMAARIVADETGHAQLLQLDVADETDADARLLMLTVMHGGLPFAGALALELGARGLDVAFDYLHASRYRGSTSGGELHWKHRPATPLQGRRVLLVDDIVDEGHTLAQVRDWCRAQGTVDVLIAALAVKQHDRCVKGLCADYAGLEVPDRYVFGYGMDWQEHGRNLPAIYAL